MLTGVRLDQHFSGRLAGRGAGDAPASGTLSSGSVLTSWLSMVPGGIMVMGIGLSGHM